MLPDPSSQLEFYRKMITIRKVEETAGDLYMRGEMLGIAHPCNGQEAVAVGVCSALRSDDYIISTHRGHGHYIAKGGDLPSMLAELLGRETGCCRGKGGTMHLADPANGVLASSGIVGGGIGVAAGAALASKLSGTDRVAVSFFGDGAANQGILFEVLNLSAVWSLPVVFVCENNLYGQYTPMKNVTAGNSLASRAEPFGIPGIVIDGTDVLDIYAAAIETVSRARTGGGPSFLECLTYRYLGHHAGDVDRPYRSKEEEAEWKTRDPIAVMRKHMIEQGMLTDSEDMALCQRIIDEIHTAVEFARTSPMPDSSEAVEDLYA